MGSSYLNYPRVKNARQNHFHSHLYSWFWLSSNMTGFFLVWKLIEIMADREHYDWVFISCLAPSQEIKSDHFHRHGNRKKFQSIYIWPISILVLSALPLNPCAWFVHDTFYIAIKKSSSIHDLENFLLDCIEYRPSELKCEGPIELTIECIALNNRLASLSESALEFVLVISTFTAFKANIDFKVYFCSLQRSFWFVPHIV